jgi:hypothetical protein
MDMRNRFGLDVCYGVPILQFILAQTGYLIDLPALDMSQMMPVLMGMLGLGGLSDSFEKFKGISK